MDFDVSFQRTFEQREKVQQELQRLELVKKQLDKDLAAQAEAHLKQTSCTDTERWRGVWSTTLDEIGQYGIGLQLYFGFLRRLGGVLVLMALMTLPLLLFSLLGSRLQDLGTMWKVEITSMGNMGPAHDLPWPMEVVTFVCGLCDALACAIFFYAVRQLRKSIPAIVAQHDQNNVTPSDFAVAISNLPTRVADHAQYGALLKKHVEDVIAAHFEPYCRSVLRHEDVASLVKGNTVIHEIILARNYNGAIQYYLKRKELVAKLQVQLRRGTRLNAMRLQRQLNQMDRQREYKNRYARTTMATVVDRQAETSDSEEHSTESSSSSSGEEQELMEDSLKKQEENEAPSIEKEGTDGLVETDAAPAGDREEAPSDPEGHTGVNSPERAVSKSPERPAGITSPDRVSSMSPERLAGLLEQTRGSRLEDEDEEVVDGKADYERPVVAAFVLFEWSLYRNVLLWAYAQARARRFVLPKALRFEGKRITVKKACEPGDVLWENVEFSAGARRCRTCATAGLSTLVLLFSCILVYCMESSESLMQGPDGSLRFYAPCSSVCSAELFWDRECQDSISISDVACAPCGDAWPVPLSAGGGISCIAFQVGECENKSTTNGTCWPEIEVEGVGVIANATQTSQGFQVALDWGDDDWTDAPIMALLGAASFCIMVVNAVLDVTLERLTKWERPMSVSGFHESLMRKLFFAQFLNTALIILVVNMSFEATYVPLLGKGDFEDVNVAWYSDVGTGILLTMMVNVVSPHCGSVFLMLWRRAYRACLWKRHASAPTEILDLYTHPSFVLSTRFAQLLVMVSTTLMYSGALPLLYACAALTCFLMYWCDKYLLLRGSRVPPPYDFRIAEAAAGYLPYAGVLHLLATIWFFGERGVFPAYQLFPGSELGGLRNALPKTIERLDSTATVFLTVELVICLVMLLGTAIVRIFILLLRFFVVGAVQVSPLVYGVARIFGLLWALVRALLALMTGMCTCAVGCLVCACPRSLRQKRVKVATALARCGADVQEALHTSAHRLLSAGLDEIARQEMLEITPGSLTSLIPQMRAQKHLVSYSIRKHPEYENALQPQQPLELGISTAALAASVPREEAAVPQRIVIPGTDIVLEVKPVRTVDSVTVEFAPELTAR